MENFYEIMKRHRLAELPVWTISTLQKQPLNPKPALKAHFEPATFHEWFQLSSDPENDLVTLDELYAEPKAPKDKIAMRVNIEQQKIMLIDIEKDFDKSILPYLKQMPAIYGEQSRHGGLHYIVKVSDDILNDDAYEQLFFKSQVKIGTTDSPHSGIEIFFHAHYLTFTQNQLAVPNNDPDGLRPLLDLLLTDTKNQNQTQAQDYVQDEELAPTDAIVLADHAIYPALDMQFKKVVNKMASSNPDPSNFEFRAIYYIASNLVNEKNQKFKRNPILKSELIEPNSVDDPKMLTWALIELTKRYLPTRNKWYRVYQNRQETYLQYTCNKVMTAVLTKKQNTV